MNRYKIKQDLMKKYNIQILYNVVEVAYFTNEKTIWFCSKDKKKAEDYKNSVLEDGEKADAYIKESYTADNIEQLENFRKDLKAIYS